jgi:hypothetical protein
MAPIRYAGFIRILTEVLESLTEPIDGEIHDAEARPRGRPRRTGNSHNPRGPSPCHLCSRRNNLQQWQTYDTFFEERAWIRGTVEGTIHRKNACPVLAAFHRRTTESD